MKNCAACHDIAVRCARAEIERDAALERAERAEKRASLYLNRFTDPEAFAEGMTLLGIPAQEVRDIYRAVDNWRKLTPTLQARLMAEIAVENVKDRTV